MADTFTTTCSHYYSKQYVSNTYQAHDPSCISIAFAVFVSPFIV